MLEVAGQFLNLGLVVVLDLLHHPLVVPGDHEVDGRPFASETTASTNPVSKLNIF